MATMPNNSTARSTVLPNENALGEGTSLVSSSSESNSDPEQEYYFESDPLVLKNNLDYQQLLRCHIKLLSQRSVAVKNLEHLLELWDYGAKDPMKFVEDFTSGNLYLPDKVTVEELPPIEWSKYNLSSLGGNVRRNTRKRVAAARAAEAAQTPTTGYQGLMVRGRPYNFTKPQTFNLPWTAEEQKRLDELLVMFPPEDIAANRFRKIAEELGSRTSIQVQSRVQKYSIALKKNKISLPGYRMPSRNVMRKQVASYRRRPNVTRNPARSIFLAPHDLEPPSRCDPSVAGPSSRVGPSSHDQQSRVGAQRCKKESSTYQHESRPKMSCNTSGGVKQEHSIYPNKSEQDVGEDNIDPNQLETEGQVRLKALALLKSYKSREQQLNSGLHFTFKCHLCKASPIEGVRYNCHDCTEALRGAPPSSSFRDASVDYCRRCHRRLMTKADSKDKVVDSYSARSVHRSHDSSHRVQKFHAMHLKSTLPRIVCDLQTRRQSVS